MGLSVKHWGREEKQRFLSVLEHFSWFPRTLALRGAAQMWTSSLYVLHEAEWLSGLAQQSYLFASQVLSRV